MSLLLGLYLLAQAKSFLLIGPLSPGPQYTLPHVLNSCRKLLKRITLILIRASASLSRIPPKRERHCYCFQSIYSSASKWPPWCSLTPAAAPPPSPPLAPKQASAQNPKPQEKSHALDGYICIKISSPQLNFPILLYLLSIFLMIIQLQDPEGVLGPPKGGHIAKLEFKKRMEKDAGAREAFDRQVKEEQERRRAIREVINFPFPFSPFVFLYVST